MTRQEIRSTLKTYFGWWGKFRTRRVLRYTEKLGVLCGSDGAFYSAYGIG